MRQHYYNFAHRVLPSDVADPALWGIISSDRAASYLDVRWNAAGASERAKGLIWIEPVTLDGIEIRTIRMPPPSSMAETHYAAIARSPDGAVRYFVAEQGDGRVFMAEWRGSMRIRWDTLAENPTIEQRNRFMDLPSNAAPWEVSATSIAGLPYLPAFLTMVADAMGDAQANAEVKKRAGAAPEKPAVAAPARSGNTNAVIIAVALLVLAIALGAIAFL